MARKPRLEIEGGLYHVIARGNDRQTIFHGPQDHARFLSLLTSLKEKHPFYLYAFCLMSNHLHLLIERREETIGRLMQRLLTGYSQYYNRRHRHVGHVFQGRHRAILCQSDGYMAELVRYIHLNPVRAKMVKVAADYPLSSHRAYLGLEPNVVIDVDPVLRLFSPKRAVARKKFQAFVAAGAKLAPHEQLYVPPSDNVFGSEEFVDEAIHHVGEVKDRYKKRRAAERNEFDAENLISAIEAVTEMSREEFRGGSKSPQAVAAKELLILAGRSAGATFAQLARLTNLDPSNISRRYVNARGRMALDAELAKALRSVNDHH